ncbi:PH domain-containing protein [Allosphingosinicella sp.]|jgi:hypothetical protein|uniref:PH domain-containing protein n=1 Tax=Allosphingosinicella sp. TaxID=2823234 RepID=UPI002EEB64BD
MRIFDVDQIPPEEHSAITTTLLPGEIVEEAFRSAETTILFTDRRIVTIQLQVLLNERIETISYSYGSLRHFSLLEGADGQSRTELRIWLGPEQPLHFRANEGTGFVQLQQLLTAKLR